MKKLLLLLTISLCFYSAAFAEEPAETAAANQPPAVAEQQQSDNETDDVKVLLNKEQLQQELEAGINNKCYLELEDSKYIAYEIDIKKDNTRRDLFKKSPAERVNHLATNNEEIYDYLVKFIQSREKSGRKYYGYRITGGIEENTATENGTTVYKFWFMKLDEDVDNGMHIPIGIGIGIGGGHHHGPWVGVGW